MIRRFALSAMAALVGCAFVVPTVCASPQDELSAAAKKVADAPNYSWHTEIENAGGGGGGGGGGGRGGMAGPTDGQVEKDGVVHLTMTRGQNTIESYANGKKGAVKIGDDWKSFAEVSADDAGGGGGGGRRNPGRMIARMMENFKAPATEATEMAAEVKDLKEADGALQGTLSEDAAKKLLTMGGGRRGGANADANAGPQIANPKGTAKFWVKDGQLAKMQYNVTGTMSFNGNDREINRTTTVEFKDVGSTKVTVPDEVKKKME